MYLLLVGDTVPCISPYALPCIVSEWPFIIITTVYVSNITECTTAYITAYIYVFVADVFQESGLRLILLLDFP